MDDVDYGLIFTAAATGQVIELPRECEDLLIAVMLNLLKDQMVLDAEFLLDDILDADEIE